MYIALTQKKDFKSEYKDELFQLYHFPAKYLSKIHTGDKFIYHQGERQTGPGGRAAAGCRRRQRTGYRAERQRLVCRELRDAPRGGGPDPVRGF